MLTAMDLAHATVCQLISDFAAHHNHYVTSGYQEAEARKDFIDPLLMALGWDVNHLREKNPFEQEVKVERGVTVSAAQRRADYAFYLRPNFRDVRFFVEAKRPSTDIVTDRDAHFQIIRYGWNAQTPLALLTNFREIHVIDCRLRPNIDTALSCVHRKYVYTDLLDIDRFAELYWIFSRESLEGGAHDRYVAALKRPPGAAKQTGMVSSGLRSIDESFLDDLEGYRQSLAQTFKSQHHELDGETLTELVQRVLDRLVFLRFLEDKLIETKDHIADFGRSDQAWAGFISASRRLDGIYNGTVFKKHPLLDQTSFLPDDDVFRRICTELSHVSSPYLFNEIPIHVLGSIYERFLGKIIVTTNRRATVEEKAEVRRAGGVYYTPEYIVRHIVESCVGPLIAGRSPAQIQKLRFADIACGSGSFLIGVFDCLLQYHVAWYNRPENAKRAAADGCVLSGDGGWHLSLEQRRQILVNNIYGVDLDSQAVEVAQLSLYLKLLEEETTATARGYQLEFHQTLLPPLNKNILAGNSLIDKDIRDPGGPVLTPREEHKLKPLHIKGAFPEVFREDLPRSPGRRATRAQRGFDAIVGNPPYGAVISEREDAYLRARYKTIANSMDTYVMFMERAASLLASDGRLGYIIPSGWVSTPATRRLRQEFSEQFRPETFVSLPYDVFKGAYIDTMIVIARRMDEESSWGHLKDPSVRLVVFPVRHKVRGPADFAQFEKEGDLSRWATNDECEFLVTSSSAELSLIEKMRQPGHRFGDYFEVMRGLESYHPGPRQGMNKPIKALASTGNVYRYIVVHDGTVYEDYTDKIAASKPMRFFHGPRILLRQLVSRKFRLQASYVEDRFLTNQSIQSLVRKQPASAESLNAAIDPRSALAVLNSRLLSWYFCQVNMVARRDDFPKIIISQTRDLPLPDLARRRSEHDRLAKLVEQLLKAKQEENEVTTEAARDYVKRKHDDLEAEIDAIVYKLFGLSGAEIDLVEGQTPATWSPIPAR